MEKIEHKQMSTPGYTYLAGPWALHPRSFAGHEAQGKTNWLVAAANDPEADYSYDDYALVYCEELKTFYILNTSGYSCPNPDETGVEVAKTSNCTSWRELQQFIAEHLGFVFFAQVVEALSKNQYEVNRVCFENTYKGYQW